MKKLLCFLSVVLAMTCLLVSCDSGSHTHSYGEWFVEANPTCDENGERVRYCDCGESQKSNIPAIGHNYIDDVCQNCGEDAPCRHKNYETISAVEATCTEGGLTEGRVCLDCEEIILVQTEIEPLGHTEVIDIEGTAATCTEPGISDAKHCDVCNEILSTQEVIEALGHDWQEMSYPGVVACQYMGCYDLVTQECSRCNEQVIEPGEGHIEGEWVVEIEPTCTTDGKQSKYCQRGGDLLEEETIPATGHTEVIDEAVTPTCTEIGLTEGKHCSVCNEVLVAQQELEMRPHKYDNVYDDSCNICGFIREAECAHLNLETIPAKDPTCTKTGLTEGQACAKCGEIFVAQDVIPATGHTEVVDPAVSPTCTLPGLSESTHCSVCRELLVYPTPIPELGHIEVIDEGVSPDCENSGLTDGSHCSRCNTVLVKQIKIPALGHTVVNDEGVEPDCVNSGLTEGAHCSTCNKVFVSQTVLDAKGHNYVDMVCTVCHKEYVSEDIRIRQ